MTHCTGIIEQKDQGVKLLARERQSYSAATRLRCGLMQRFPNIGVSFCEAENWLSGSINGSLSIFSWIFTFDETYQTSGK